MPRCVLHLSKLVECGGFPFYSQQGCYDRTSWAFDVGPWVLLVWYGLGASLEGPSHLVDHLVVAVAVIDV